MTFGELCKLVREERGGLSQREVALRGGISDPARISEIERNVVDPSMARARQVARGLGVLLTDLVARWEGVQLIWTKPGGKALAEMKGENVNGDVTEGGSSMPGDRLAQSFGTFLGLVPEDKQDDYAEHCFHLAMRLKRGHVATGTDPKG